MSVASAKAIPWTTREQLEYKIQTKSAQTAVVGLGYVGLPLLTELARAGFPVTGVDKDPGKIRSIRSGHSYVADVDREVFRTLVRSGKITADLDGSSLSSCDTVSICVPTPLQKSRDPDLSAIVAVSEALVTHLHPGMLIILESTTYPGTTEEIILPTLCRSGMKVGEDFFLCFSPERVDPGNPRYKTHNIPKVIGGVTPACTELGGLFYSQIVESVVPVGSTRVAEMVKLLENTFRMINIGLANEIAVMCDRMEIDVWEVIQAAATKPFGFMPFYPGPGLGGHCIPVDPHYLSWKTRQSGHECRFIELAAQINRAMPSFVVEKIQAALNDHSKPVKGSRIHIVGVAYKPDVSDTRESPALDIITMLVQRGAIVTYSDPLVPELRLPFAVLENRSLESTVSHADCVVIVTDHSSVDYEDLADAAVLTVDTRNRLRRIEGRNVVRL